MKNNYVMLIGSVSGEPKRTAMQNGGSILTFDLRTTENWRSRDSRDPHEFVQHSEYHHIVMRDSGRYRVASRYAGLIKSGNRILLEGKIRNRIYKSYDGRNNMVSEIEADSIELMARPEMNDDAGSRYSEQRPESDNSRQTPYGSYGNRVQMYPQYGQPYDNAAGVRVPREQDYGQAAYVQQDAEKPEDAQENGE